MRIQFERTGGVAGIPLVIDLDSDSLPQQEQLALQELVEAADFFRLPERITTPLPVADRFVYLVMIEAEAQTQTVIVNEAAVPSSLRPLLEWLTTAGRRRRGRG